MPSVRVEDELSVDGKRLFCHSISTYNLISIVKKRNKKKMEKLISFVVPTVGEEGSCYVTVDDGRIFQVNLPEHVAAGQTVVATADSYNMYLEYYHNEGDVGSEYGRAVPKLVIGNVVTEIDDMGQPVGAGTTVGQQPMDSSPTAGEKIRNEVLSSTMVVRVLAATKQVLNRVSDLDAEYKVSENVTNTVSAAMQRADELDKEYKISEKASAAAYAALDQVNAAVHKVDHAIRGDKDESARKDSK